VRWSEELARVEGIEPTAPEHLAGVPGCLHKYEPLFRRAAAEQQLPVAH
jgi:hypothetical protein